MDIQQMLQQYWPEWKVTGILGEGSYGKVYQAQRHDIAGITNAAIKVTRVPHDDSEYNAMRMENMSQDQVRTYLRGVVQDLSVEIRAMESVKGYTNIVTIEDYKVIEQDDGLTWFILIRMALLTPLNRYQQQNPLGEGDVIRLGKDLCTALMVCRKKNIVHRDIKPENIFINEQGDFVLGDFGVARSMERLTSGMTRIGTYNYMAPELFNNTMGKMNIDEAARMDIYSLGLVMYQLMNDGRLPLMQDSAVISPQGRQDALLRRMKGEALPRPCKASEGLSNIILKACAFEPDNRYPSAEAMRHALEALKSMPVNVISNDKTVRLNSCTKPIPETKSEIEPQLSAASAKPIEPDLSNIKRAAKRKDSHRKKIPIFAVAAMVLIAGVAALILFSSTINRGDENIEGNGGVTKEENAENTEDEASVEVPVSIETVAPAETNIAPEEEMAAVDGGSSEHIEAVTEDETLPEDAMPSQDESPAESDASTQIAIPTEDASSTGREDSKEDMKPSGNVMSNNDELPSEDTDSSDNDVPVNPTDTAITAQTVEPGVIFNNSQIEDSVRAALNKPQGDLYEGDLSSVKKIVITDKNLTDISDLAKLPGLTEVCLSNNKITDISSLAGLADLKELVLSNNSISDITVLKGLTNLETLNLSMNEITDVSPLIGMKKLRKLYLNRNEGLVDVSMLSDLALDEYVGPSMSPVVTFKNHTIEEAIRAELNLKKDEMIREEDLGRVKSLDLSKTGTASIDELTKLTNLEALTLADNEIEDISMLGSLSDLKVLILKDNRIEDISALQSLKNLGTLDLSENAVSDISALSELKGMKNLYLSGNQIADIAPLSNLNEIEVLHIDGVSEDIDLAYLSDMRKLKEYKGPEVKWPVDKDATIVGLWSSSVKDIAISKIAFGDAFATGGITKTGSIEVSNEKAIEYLNGCIEGTIQSEVKIDGICLFPYEGIDYTESLAKAVVNGVAIHIMSADEPEDIYAEICDMVGMTSHGTWQRYLDWPTDKDATIVGFWSRDIEDTTAAKAAFADAFIAAGVNRTGSIDASKEKAIEYLDGCIEGTIQPDMKIDGICLFPYEDLDYSESIAKAIVNGVSIHIMSAKEPEGIFKEICSMYDINEMYQYRSTVEWPIDKEAVIVTLYTESAAVSDELMDAVEQASIAVGYDRTIGRLIATEDQSAKYLEFCIDGGNNGTDAINAVYLFPYEGVDYSSVLRKADQKGIAVYLFSSEDPEDVFDEICKLYNRRDIINPFSNAGDAVG